MDCLAGSAHGGAPGNFAFMGAVPGRQPERPVDGSRCMTCPVRSQCIGGVAAHAGTRQLQDVLAGRRVVRAGDVMLLPAGAVLAVRSGSLKSISPFDDMARPLAFHFPGEAVAGGQRGVRLVALDEAELCVMRTGGAAAGGVYEGRLWDMLSREVMRERAEANMLAGLPLGRRAAAFLASLTARARASGTRSRMLLLSLSAADIAAYLRAPESPVGREGGVRWRESPPIGTIGNP